MPMVEHISVFSCPYTHPDMYIVQKDGKLTMFMHVVRQFLPFVSYLDVKSHFFLRQIESLVDDVVLQRFLMF